MLMPSPFSPLYAAKNDKKGSCLMCGDFAWPPRFKFFASNTNIM